MIGPELIQVPTEWAQILAVACFLYLLYWTARRLEPSLRFLWRHGTQPLDRASVVSCLALMCGTAGFGVYVLASLILELL